MVPTKYSKYDMVVSYGLVYHAHPQIVVLMPTAFYIDHQAI